MRWNPEPLWEGADVYILGGGASLQGFDWSMLKDEFTIGCNSAFRLGVDVCKACIFGDRTFYEKYYKELTNYEGDVYCNSPQITPLLIPWLREMPRKQNGLFFEALGWAGNTGSSAINLALLLGARRVLLLGFDMKLGAKGENNWHNFSDDEVTDKTFLRFKRGFEGVRRDWLAKFPDVEIINLNLDSDLEAFPKMSFDHFKSQQKAR